MFPTLAKSPIQPLAKTIALGLNLGLAGMCVLRAELTTRRNSADLQHHVPTVVAHVRLQAGAPLPIALRAQRLDDILKNSIAQGGSKTEPLFTASGLAEYVAGL